MQLNCTGYCTNCGSILIPGVAACWQCGCMYNRPPALSYPNVHNNEVYQADVSGMALAAQNTSERNQKIFSIINIIFGILSLILAGFFLGIVALTIAQRAKASVAPQKRLTLALNLNLIALAVNILAILAIVMLGIFFGAGLFRSPYTFY